MSQIHFPFADNFPAQNRSQIIETYLNRSANVYVPSREKEQLSFVLHGKLGGKIKFMLGLAYFCSLIYFTIKLLT